ncbi:hypothetical protein WR25_04771 [Diploscapter pachys]|uniref:G-protein coupled receptors family 1 profile domain-containing protein n=1 Tax=Diploscapter pachys TaxID=2018661 RepID=A0A2A2L467_9BILA|nr:hypothetical protein WR25_04771 [Diploscapter pachys]
MQNFSLSANANVVETSPAVILSVQDEQEQVDNKLFMSVVNISLSTPLDWAIPIYGHLMPALVCITAVTNSFIMLVLYQKHLRTPTNMVLFAMALTDLLTGLTSFPWFFFYYTLKGYQTDILHGLSPFWCKAHAYMADSLPSFLHSSAIWLTVFLAVQRYVYVCTPSEVNRYCTPKNTKIVIVCIFITSFIFSLPEIISKRRFSLSINGRRECYVQIVPWVMKIMTRDMYYSCLYWSRVTLHGVPCILILIPATLIYGIQIIVANRLIERSSTHYLIINRLVVMRNLLIVLASPIEFAIYCSMSEQFRLTVRQLFSSKLLFVAQAQATFHGGKRYSLILVDVEEVERQKDSAAFRLSRLFGSFNSGDDRPRRKVARQSSFPNENPEMARLQRNGNVSGSFQPSKYKPKLSMQMYRYSNSQLRVPSIDSTTHISASSF